MSNSIYRLSEKMNNSINPPEYHEDRGCLRDGIESRR